MEHRIGFKVYYEDTDSLGMVYYANYFKYFERGRSEFIESTGRSVAEWNAQGYNFVVHSVEATFRRPLSLGEVFDVVTVLEDPSPYRARFRQRVERDGTPYVIATIDAACLDAHGSLTEIPAGLRQHAEPVTKPGR